MSTFRRGEGWAYKFSFSRKQILRSGFPTEAEASSAERQHRKLMLAGMVAEADRIFRRRGGLTVGQILDGYCAAGCPDHQKQPRTGSGLASEVRNCETLRGWWGPKLAEHLRDSEQDGYHAHRLTTVTRGTGHRTTELELNALRNAIAWAARTDQLSKPPRLSYFRYRLKGTVSHARDFMPRSGDEVHRIAAFLLGWKPGTQVYGWAALLAALTGLRSAELRALRACPPRPDLLNDPEPGHWDHEFLYIHRAKRGTNPQVRLDDPERPDILPLLNKILAWKGANYPASPFLLPNSEGNDLETSAITRALQEAADHLRLPERTAHGLRAYYATVRLSQGRTTSEVAGELGQRSGDDLVKDVYGADPKTFKTDRIRAAAGVLTWAPNTPGKRPAWDLIPTHVGTRYHFRYSPLTYLNPPKPTQSQATIENFPSVSACGNGGTA